MEQTEIETAFAELVENITGPQPARIDRDLHLDKLGLDSLSKIDLAVLSWHIHLPAGPGHGIMLDPDQLRRYARQ